jgi:murein DD-endopeptidase MepM/ murein hydrolase activator NlpD
VSTRDLWLDDIIRQARQQADDAASLVGYLERYRQRTRAERKYCAPVGTETERREKQVWPGRWVDATGFLRWYAFGLHTGADLNLNSPRWDADAHSPVYSIASGQVYAVQTNVSGWHTVVCIRHEDCLSRYAHVENIQVREGQQVEMGQYIANIGNAGGRYPYHLHFDLAKPDARMAKYPRDWPSNRAAGRAAEDIVRRDYFDPGVFLRERV